MNKYKKILTYILIPIACLAVTPVVLTQCASNKNNSVTVNSITADGIANSQTTTALTLIFGGTNGIPNLDKTGFLITDESGNKTSVTISSASSTDDGHIYTINISGITAEAQTVKIIVNDVAGYDIKQYDTAITLHKADYLADGTN